MTVRRNFKDVQVSDFRVKIEEEGRETPRLIRGTRRHNFGHRKASQGCRQLPVHSQVAEKLPSLKRQGPLANDVCSKSQPSSIVGVLWEATTPEAVEGGVEDHVALALCTALIDGVDSAPGVWTGTGNDCSQLKGVGGIRRRRDSGQAAVPSVVVEFDLLRRGLIHLRDSVEVHGSL